MHKPFLERENAFHQEHTSPASTTGHWGSGCCQLFADGDLRTDPSGNGPQTGKRQQASLLGWRDLFFGPGVCGRRVSQGPE
jgi:hypothetical protein